ncbi:MAG: signal transduction histidine kinase with CheB and CheR [Chthoniobacteraceae bacterium]|nr:signal transduction histidine kinase with CheB and CheR [Chthoniobacteraceae bacterium]
MPPDSGMAFAVILHLSPEHESTLAELLQRTTRMQVVQATNLKKVEINCIYVIPPGKYLSSVDERLRLTQLRHWYGKRVAVDLFFRSLADSHGPHAVAILLSGADGDGAIGIKRIKERGGLTIAQDPEEAEHPSMPRAAIETGMVDWVLEVAQIPHRLLQYRENERRLRLPPEENFLSAQRPRMDGNENEQALGEVMILLRNQTGRDFSCYKRATILRRLARRMQINGTLELTAYLDFLGTHPGEAKVLVQELLVTVTNFFRDRDCFTALQAIIPALFEGKGPNDTVRIWVAACATGEEAYSLAMLLCEHAGQLKAPPMLQVFATDLDEEAIRLARRAVYPATISADVSDERLSRFFIEEDHHYRLRQEVRETVLFAVHDALKDSPFSRLDLVSCRNLLIYLNRSAQARLIDTFHFALRPEGWLFLASSESIEEGSRLFGISDKKHRIFQQRPIRRTSMPVPSVAPKLRDMRLWTREGIPLAGDHLPLATQGTPAGLDPQLSWSELHFKLLEQLAAPSVIVNQDYEIQHLSEKAGRFLQFTGGEPTMNLLRLVHPMLRIELRSALYRAKETGTAIEVNDVAASLDGTAYLINLRVGPSRQPEPDFFLVIFDAKEKADDDAVRAARSVPDPAWNHLERELEEMKVHLRDTVEQYEASTEELKASNEELQAINEELRSATEELETSREELQSINEELVTVNSELKNNVYQLGHANSDMQNLMAATAIPTLFLDRELRIMRYTPSAVKLFHLIASDIGRPITDLRHHLQYPQLLSDTAHVLAELAPIEREVADETGEHWFLARLLPYRTIEDGIGGVVLTLVDITEQKRANSALCESEERYRALTNASSQVIFRMSPDWSELLQLQGGEFLANTEDPSATWLEDYIHPHDLPLVEKLSREAVLTKKIFQSEHRVMRVDGTWGYAFTRAIPLFNAAGEIVEWFGAATDVTKRKHVEEALRESEDRMRRAFQIETVGVLFFHVDGRIIESNDAFLSMCGCDRGDLIEGRVTRDQMTPGEWMARSRAAAEEFQTTGRTTPYEIEYLRKDGRRWWALLASTRLNENEGVEFIVDITTRKLTEQALVESREELLAALKETEEARQEAEAAGRAKDHFLAVLSHELRTPLTPVMMIGEMLLGRPDLAPRVRDGLETICRNVKLEAHFIDDLLDVTRIRNCKLELELVPLNLHDVINRAVEITESELAVKEQRLILNLSAQFCQIEGDFSRLQQVFWNLLKNASKFTPPCGELRLNSRNEAGSILVEISDTGRGIAPEALPYIFEAFRQGDESITREFGGLGLGLAISKATIDGHRGNLSGSSAGIGQGALFTVELPLSVTHT